MMMSRCRAKSISSRCTVRWLESPISDAYPGVDSLCGVGWSTRHCLHNPGTPRASLGMTAVKPRPAHMPTVWAGAARQGSLATCPRAWRCTPIERRCSLRWPTPDLIFCFVAGGLNLLGTAHSQRCHLAWCTGTAWNRHRCWRHGPIFTTSYPSLASIALMSSRGKLPSGAVIQPLDVVPLTPLSPSHLRSSEVCIRCPPMTVTSSDADP